MRYGRRGKAGRVPAVVLFAVTFAVLVAGSVSAQDRHSGRPRYRPGQSQRIYVWESTREFGDWVRLSEDGTLLAFGFANAGFVDGFRFQTDAGALTALVKINGVRAERREIYLGRRGVHPLINPFTLLIRGKLRDYQVNEDELQEDRATQEVEELIPESELEDEDR